MKTVDQLLDESGLSIEELADRACLPPARAVAIVTGRWTPSPAERKRLAAVFAISVDDVSWGHTMDPRNIRYRRFGMKESF